MGLRWSSGDRPRSSQSCARFWPAPGNKTGTGRTSPTGWTRVNPTGPDVRRLGKHDGSYRGDEASAGDGDRDLNMPLETPTYSTRNQRLIESLLDFQTRIGNIGELLVLSERIEFLDEQLASLPQEKSLFEVDRKVRRFQWEPATTANRPVQL